MEELDLDHDSKISWHEYTTALFAQDFGEDSGLGDMEQPE